MRFLVLFFHADPSMRARYELACTQKNVDMDLVFINRNGLSSVYRQLARECRDGSKRYLPGLIRRYRSRIPRGLGSYDATVLCSFSAGYGATTTILTNSQDANDIDAVVSIDSWHAGLDPDGTAKDSDLLPLLQFAVKAKAEEKLLFLGHTDVRTYGYASTTQVANELERLAGGCSGDFVIRSENLSHSDRTEHGLALTNWGPGFLADALVRLKDRKEAEALLSTEHPPVRIIPAKPLGVRALTIAKSEKKDGIREIPGKKHSTVILGYFAPCMRNGQNIGRYLITDETPWCAAGFCWCADEAIVTGETVPHRYRCAVRELWSDAISSGTARAIKRVREATWQPSIGDGVIMVRGGSKAGSTKYPFSTTRGRGHVGRLVSFDDDTGDFKTLDANVKDRWSYVQRHIADPELVGFIEYPKARSSDCEVSQSELEEMRRLFSLSDNVMKGNHGLDWAWEQLPAGL